MDGSWLMINGLWSTDGSCFMVNGSRLEDGE